MAIDADTAHWEVLGQLSEASNATLLVEVSEQRFVYKPVAGERPLWDFPDGTLGHREVAAYQVAAALGWDLVPETVWVEQGPYGPGSLQQWVQPTGSPVDLFPVGQVPAGWVGVLRGYDAEDREIEVAHRDDAEMMRMALFDILINNADRKGGHLFTMADSEVVGIDQGLCFHHEPKLRTVLWGFVGREIPAEFRQRIESVREELPELLTGLPTLEREALGHRARVLVDSAEFPAPTGGGPAVPWPPL